MFSRVKQTLEERKREIREDIEVKDERSKMVNTEKEEIRRLVSYTKYSLCMFTSKPRLGSVNW